MKIPIKNIYYLLSYAWNKLEIAEKLKVSESDYDNAIELFARVLINGCIHLQRTGLEHHYISVTEEYRGVKGKIEFQRSLNKNLFRQGKSVCTYDQFSPDILQNQLIKATIRKLFKLRAIDKDIKNQLRIYFCHFDQVSDIEVEDHFFSKVVIHRNNTFYSFLLSICRLINQNIVIDESTGELHFSDFIREDKAMAALFEEFIRNFYRKHLNGFIVKRENIQWKAFSLANSNKGYLPLMKTDINLESEDRKIIIESKYYSNAFNVNFDVEKFNSSNLYQLYAYLRNIECTDSHPLNSICEGILLYPAVGYTINEMFQMGTHKVSVRTIDLGADWKELSRSLIEIVEDEQLEVNHF